MDETIKEGFMVFVSDGDAGVGSVRKVGPDGRSELVIYVENAGDFIVPLSAVDAVHDDKVILNCDRITPGLRKAIGHAHDAEDPNFVARAGARPSAGLSAAFIAQQRQRLETLRAQLLGDEGEREANARDYQETHGKDSPELEERAQNLAQNEIRQARHDVDLRRLSQIERALRKIDDGSYGLSDASGEPIPQARLEIAPEASLTVEEERKRENK